MGCFENDNSISFTGVRVSRSNINIIKYHVEKWIQRQQTLMFRPKQTSYSVHVTKESDVYYSCHIEIRIGARHWSGIGEGRSIQDSVLNSLRSLKPKELLGIYDVPNINISSQITA